ncbi:hypothetical protein FRB99_000267 [Tulasnella sp. 403]|nr:hypothetical protein FRB99_000267 [Tulasnella sp. 403]
MFILDALLLPEDPELSEIRKDSAERESSENVAVSISDGSPPPLLIPSSTKRIPPTALDEEPRDSSRELVEPPPAPAIRFMLDSRLDEAVDEISGCPSDRSSSPRDSSSTLVGGATSAMNQS